MSLNLMSHVSLHSWMRLQEISIKPPEAQTVGYNRFSVTALRRNPPCWHLDLRLLVFRALRQHILLLKPPSSWHFVMAAGKWIQQVKERLFSIAIGKLKENKQKIKKLDSSLFFQYNNIHWWNRLFLPTFGFLNRVNVIRTCHGRMN